MNVSNFIIMNTDKNDKSFLFLLPHGSDYVEAHEALTEFSATILEMKKNALKAKEGVTE